jgi:hypothetical protein
MSDFIYKEFTDVQLQFVKKLRSMEVNKLIATDRLYENADPKHHNYWPKNIYIEWLDDWIEKGYYTNGMDVILLNTLGNYYKLYKKRTKNC